MNPAGVVALGRVAVLAAPEQTFRVEVDGVRGEPLTHLREAAAALVERMHPGDRAAVMTFSGTVSLDCDWTDDRGRLLAALGRVEAGGATALHDAAYAGLMLRDTLPGRPLVLVFSDAADTASWLPGARVIELAQRLDAVVYAVTLSSPDRRALGYLADFTSGIQPSLEHVAPVAFKESFVGRLTGETGGRVLSAEDSGQLRNAFETTVAEFRTRYVITYIPRGVDAGGWHPLEVRVRSRPGRVTARRGYLR